MATIKSKIDKIVQYPKSEIKNAISAVANGVEINLTAANIVAMNTTPVEVVPAPGAGYVLEFISAALIYDYDTATYTGGGDVTLEYSGGAAVSNGCGC